MYDIVFSILNIIIMDSVPYQVYKSLDHVDSNNLLSLSQIDSSIILNLRGLRDSLT